MLNWRFHTGFGLFKSKKRSSQKSDAVYAQGYGYRQYEAPPPAYIQPQGYTQDVAFYPQMSGQPRPTYMPEFSQPATSTSYYTSNRRPERKSVAFAPTNGYY